SKTRARYKKLSDFVDRAIAAESARWGDSRRSTPYTRGAEWITERDRLLDQYFAQRTNVALGFLRGAQLYPNIDAPVFSQHGGDVPTDYSLTMTNPNGSGTMYYTLDGEDPRLPITIIGGSQTTLVAEDAAKKVLIPASDIGNTWQGGNEPYADSGWTDFVSVAGKTGGVGYDDNPTYDPYISYDVTTAMDAVRTTAYIRIPFTVDSETLSGMNSLILKVRYDDGFLAFINGEKLTAEANPPTTTPDWQSSSNGLHDDGAAVNFQSFDISGKIGALQAGDNILAIHGLNTSITSSDFLISVELIASDEVTSGGISPSAIEYTGPVLLTKSQQVKSRVLEGAIWSALNEATFSVGPVADSLRVTEMMYHPADAPAGDPNAEYIELQNVGAQPINLNLVRFTNGIDFTFGDLTLNAGAYVVVVQNQAAFDNEYPIFSGVIAGQYSGRLDNGGERLRVADALDVTIQDFRYKDSWRSITDGEGFSLTIIDPASIDPTLWDQREGWRASAYLKGSPGADDSGIVPNPGAIVINEVLAHSDTIAYDFIELHNTTAGDIDLNGWYLSDENSNQIKYEIKTGDTVIQAGQYKVFYENLHFGVPGDAGVNTAFALSENGEKVVLRSGQGGVLTGYRNAEVFGASASDIALGRYQKSTGTFNFVAMSSNTPNAANAYPRVGPVVISEIMYHPAGNGDAEYIELVNISGSIVTLYDASVSTGWRMTDGIDFTFPASPVTLNPNEVLLLVKNLAAFNSEFPSAPVGVQKYEWSSGSLSNGGERVQLAIPGDLELGVRQYIRIDRVTYDDIAPWPTNPDGLGQSLERKVLSDYGNDVANWQGAAASPGL
ncbi:MAG: lamin tail domain-containing protein, partial [Planctomycetes bacterium]|nr:lamin tail domain-containing protein [Planctomycetota bacterium]